jgi:cytolysin-activating lysine-acyltransferase
MSDEPLAENAGAKTPSKAGRGSQPSNLEIFGEMCWLYSQSKIHRNWPIGSIQRWLLPAILSQQMRVYRKNGKPYAFVTWAFLSKEVEEAFVLNTASLQPKDWKSGKRIWFIDWVAPFGGTREMTLDLKHNVFPNDVGRFLRMKEGSDTLNIFYVHGANAIDRARDRTVDPAVHLARRREGMH